MEALEVLATAAQEELVALLELALEAIMAAQVAHSQVLAVREAQ